MQHAGRFYSTWWETSQTQWKEDAAQQRAEEADAKGDTADADVMDLVTQVHLKLSTQLKSRVEDLEVATYCPLFLPKDNDIVKEMQDAGRFYSEMVTSHSDKERGLVLANGGLNLPD